MKVFAYTGVSGWSWGGCLGRVALPVEVHSEQADRENEEDLRRTMMTVMMVTETMRRTRRMAVKVRALFSSRKKSSVATRISI